MDYKLLYIKLTEDLDFKIFNPDDKELWFEDFKYCECKTTKDREQWRVVVKCYCWGIAKYYRAKQMSLHDFIKEMNVYNGLLKDSLWETDRELVENITKEIFDINVEYTKNRFYFTSDQNINTILNNILTQHNLF